MKRSKGISGFLNLPNWLTFLLIFLPLVLFIAILQHFIFLEHLNYGFRDVDWTFIKDYKRLLPINPENLINAWRKWGVYTYQVYFIGIQEHIFGINFTLFNYVTHFFKLLSTITLFPLVLLITRSKLAAVIVTLIYASAYPAVGAMFSVVTSGNYFAVALMNIFLLTYWYIVEKGKSGWSWLLSSLFLLLLTLFLSTERMYPLLFLILIFESFIFWKKQFSKDHFKIFIKRTGIFFVPVLLVFIFKPHVFTQFFGNTSVILQYISQGNWQLILTPLASYGSIFFPNEYGKIFGVVDISSLKNYLIFLLGAPLVIFGFCTILIANLFSVKPIRFSINTMILTGVLSLVTYALASHNLGIDQSKRIHFDQSYLIPVLNGVYMLALSINLAAEYLKNNSNSRLLLAAFLGPLTAFLFVFLTWVPADPYLIFMGPHRYLTVPAIGASIFLGCILVVIYYRLRNFKFFGNFAWVIFLILIPLTLMNASIIHKFFYNEVEFAGLDGRAQTRMKTELWSYLKDFSNEEPSFFWFDESQDYKNGYYHESAVIAGFETWMLFRGSDLVDDKLSPLFLRTNLVCPELRINCTEKLAEYIEERDGVKGLFVKEKFIKPENIYGFRLKDRMVINITGEIKQEIGI